VVSDKDNNGEPSDHVPPLVSETLRLRILLTVVALPFATRRRNETYLGDRAVSTHLEGASRPRTRRSQVCISSSSTCWTLSTPTESCVSKHIDGQKLQQSNQTLEEAGASLRKERDGLQLYHEKQLARRRFFDQALESSSGTTGYCTRRLELPFQTQSGRDPGHCKTRVRVCLFRALLFDFLVNTDTTIDISIQGIYSM
jgi:hypothetical protein